MKTARRAPIEPDAKFGRTLTKVRKTGEKLVVDGITIIPPSGASKTWRLRTSYSNHKIERKSPDTNGDVNAAFLSLISEVETLMLGGMGLPEHSKDSLAETINNYIEQGGPKSEWRGKTPSNRREDFIHLVKLAEKENLKCMDLNASVVRRYLTNATGSGRRAKGLLGVIRTFTKWGVGAGYFTTSQLDAITHVTWNPPKGSNYKIPPTRREQSKLHFGTSDIAGGEVPTHEQVTLLAQELQKHYIHGEALIHVSANIGTRANETFILTASRDVHDSGHGNYVDLSEELVRVHWQASNGKTKAQRVTKNNKFRSVVIPPVESIQTGFDVFAWLSNRSAEALKEQAAGKNPRALLFPSAKGEVMNLEYFNREKMRKALLALGWKMPSWVDAKGVTRSLFRFTLHSLRDRYGTTAADEWNYSERQLLEQGSWADSETVRKFYLGTTDETHESVKQLHRTRKVFKQGKRAS